MTTSQADLILVTGGTGKTGRRVIRRLESKGLAVRVGSRSGEPRFDWGTVRRGPPRFDESDFAGPILTGELALPGADVRTPFVDADDIADVAVAALTEDGHAGEVYVLSGPRRMTFAEVAQEISAATGRPVRYVPLTLDEFSAGMAADGVPEDVASLLTYLFSEVLVDSNGELSDGVRRALGREPRDFRDFARDAAAAGAWND